jgi:hypothetical protein
MELHTLFVSYSKSKETFIASGVMLVTPQNLFNNTSEFLAFRRFESVSEKLLQQKAKWKGAHLTLRTNFVLQFIEELLGTTSLCGGRATWQGPHIIARHIV